MKNFDDVIEPTIPPAGHITSRARGRNVRHGVDFEIQIRTLRALNACEVFVNAITALLSAAIDQDVAEDDIRLILKTAETAALDPSARRWNFGAGEIDGEGAR